MDLLNSSTEREHFAQRITILMFLSVMGIVTSFFYAALFKFYLNYSLASFAVSIFGTFYLVSGVLAKIKLFFIARHILTINFIIQITFFSAYLFPKDTNFQLYFLVATPLIYLLFSYQHNHTRIIYSGLAIVALIFIDIFNLTAASPFTISPDKIETIRTFNVFSSLTVLAITIYLFANMMEKTEQKYREQATTDSLTGLFNRRYFFDFGERVLSLYKRSGKEFSLIFLDIDHFKSINDTFGHDIGDQVLSIIAKTIVANVRSTDIVARIGGEEFVVIFFNTHQEHAAAKAEVIRLAIATTELLIDELQVTTSIGVSEVSDRDSSINDLLIRADKALYTAKNNGRNLVETFKETTSIN